MTTMTEDRMVTVTCGWGADKHTHTMPRTQAMLLAGQCPDTIPPVPGEGVCEAPAPVKDETMLAPADVTPPIPMGIYTIETDEGHRTFKVVYQRPDAEFAPGSTILEYLHGRDNEWDYKAFAFLRTNDRGKPTLHIWKKYQGSETLVRDALFFMDHFGDEGVLVARHCFRCGRVLTVPSSINAGLGPECVKKGW